MPGSNSVSECLNDICCIAKEHIVSKHDKSHNNSVVAVLLPPDSAPNADSIICILYTNLSYRTAEKKIDSLSHLIGTEFLTLEIIETAEPFPLAGDECEVIYETHENSANIHHRYKCNNEEEDEHLEPDDFDHSFNCHQPYIETIYDYHKGDHCKDQNEHKHHHHEHKHHHKHKHHKSKCETDVEAELEELKMLLRNLKTETDPISFFQNCDSKPITFGDKFVIDFDPEMEKCRSDSHPKMCGRYLLDIGLSVIFTGNMVPDFNLVVYINGRLEKKTLMSIGLYPNVSQQINQRYVLDVCENDNIRIILEKCNSEFTPLLQILDKSFYSLSKM